MKPKLIRVSTPNRMLFIKGKLIRTPLDAIINFEDELRLIESSMIHQGISFTIEDYIPEKINIPKIIEVVNEPLIEKTKSEPKSILEKLSQDE